MKKRKFKKVRLKYNKLYNVIIYPTRELNIKNKNAIYTALRKDDVKYIKKDIKRQNKKAKKNSNMQFWLIEVVDIDKINN